MVLETLKKELKEFNLRRTLTEYKRIIQISKKPTSDEFKQIVRVSGIGMIAIGITGFVIQIFFQVFQGLFT